MAATNKTGFLSTLSGRFVLLSVGVAIMAAVVTTAVSIPLITGAAEAQAQANLDRLADVTVQALQRPGSPGSTRRIEDLLSSQQVSAFVVGPELPPAPGVDSETEIAIIEGDEVSAQMTVDGADYFVAARPIDGTFGLVLRTPDLVATEPADEAIQRLVVALFIGVAVAVAVGYLVSRRVTEPLRRAADTAERLTSGERGLQVDPSGPTEVADLASSLNNLSAALAVSEGRQRDFLLSVSHELRTPLTAVRGYAEALADEMVAPADVQRTGQIMLDESDRLDRIVADLLVLARLRAVDFSINPVTLDLRELVLAAAEVWASRCEREGVPFTSEIHPESVYVQTDPVRLRQIIDNLAENALRVTPSGKPIVVSLAVRDESAVVGVRDGGPGLTPDDMAVAFEPAALYARYRGVRPVGSGLGLALVGSLAARMNGAATVRQSVEGGAAFEVCFPLAATPEPPAHR